MSEPTANSTPAGDDRRNCGDPAATSGPAQPAVADTARHHAWTEQQADALESLGRDYFKPKPEPIVPWWFLPVLLLSFLYLIERLCCCS